MNKRIILRVGGTPVTNHTHVRYATKVFPRMEIYKNICGYIQERNHIAAIIVVENSPLLHNLNFMLNGTLVNARGNVNFVQNAFCIRIHGNAMCVDIKGSVLFNVLIAIGVLQSNGH